MDEPPGLSPLANALRQHHAAPVDTHEYRGWVRLPEVPGDTGIYGPYICVPQLSGRVVLLTLGGKYVGEVPREWTQEG